MPAEIKFSIGIPAYKSSYLYECISSILTQSYVSFELIIVNDNSPDPIERVVKQFDDSRIRYFKNNKNIGAENVINNWNKCLEKARGDFFVLMGDDDKMEKNYLEEFNKLLLKFPDLDVFHCRSKIIDKNSNPIDLTPSWPEYESVYENIWHRKFLGRVQFISDFVYRKEFLVKNVGFFYLPLAWGSDDITSYIAISNKGIAHINKPLLNYRRHPTTLSSIGSTEIKMKAILMQKNWFDEFLKNKPIAPNDLIIYKTICEGISKQFQKEKVYIISLSLKTNFLFNILKWSRTRKAYDLQISLIAYSIIEFIRAKIVKRRYNTPQ